MPFADHHDMVKAFPSNRSNHALGIGVLPVTLASRSPGEVGGMAIKEYLQDLVGLTETDVTLGSFRTPAARA